MIGAIIGDIVGSAYEWNNTKTKNFELFPASSSFTDINLYVLIIRANPIPYTSIIGIAIPGTIKYIEMSNVMMLTNDSTN